MTAVMIISKGCGMFRDMLIASIYGASYEADVFITASRIPLLFFDFTLGVAILSTFIPVFNNFLEKEGKSRAIEFANNFITAIAIITVALSLLGVIFSRQIAFFMAPSFSADKINATASLLNILFPTIVFTALAYSAVGILQSFEEFNVPAVISLISNGFMIAYLLIFGDTYGLSGVSTAMLIGWSFQLLVQIPSLKKKGFKYKFSLNFKDEGLKEVLRLALPVLISSWVQPICVTINMQFGSYLQDGSIAGLEYANKLNILIVGVFTFAVTNFLFPKLSRLSSSGSINSFIKISWNAVKWIIFIIAPIMLIFLAFPEFIISVLYQRGKFDHEALKITSSALRYYSVGMVGYAACEILNKSFYAMHNGKTPMYASIIGISFNIAVAALFVFAFKMEAAGLALASALGTIITAMVLVWRFYRYSRSFNNAKDAAPNNE